MLNVFVLSVITLSVAFHFCYTEYLCAECHYAECRLSFTVMLNVFVLSVIKLSVVVLSLIFVSKANTITLFTAVSAA